MNKKSGEAAECYFDYRAMMEGFVVSEPRGDSAPYDRIVEFGGSLKKVQIKMRSSHDNVKMRSYVVNVTKADGSGYTADEIDIVAILLRNEDLWYFIPVSLIKKKVRVNPKKDKFDQFKNNWEMLK